MEPRKRPLIDAEDSVVTKKRILTGANGSPHVNGSSEGDEEELFREKLEHYRKEAIFRKMKHYSRENDRSAARIRELERRKTTCEAGVAALSACWSQLVETIRLFVKTDDIPEATLRAKEIFDLTARIDEESSPELSAALGDTVNATQALVTKFVQLSGDKQSNILQNGVFPECQKAQNENVVLRSEVTLLRARLQESDEQKDSYHNALIAAENRFERSRSSIVHEVESKGKTKGEAGMDEKEEVLLKPSSPALSSTPTTPMIHNNGFHDIPSEIAILHEQLRSRDNKIVELEKEAALLKDEKTMIQLEHKAPTYEQICQNPFFKVLLDHVALQDVALKENIQEIFRLTEDLQQLQQQLATRTELYNSDRVGFEQTISDYKAKLEEKIDDSVRLRMQRNQLQAENNERKTKDSVRFASLHEYKTLLENNLERITVLQSELRRCKAQLATKAGRKDLSDFFLGGNHDEAEFFDNIKQQKARLAALEQTLSGLDSEHPDLAKHMRMEADALETLEQANLELEKYRQTFGESSNLPPDAATLAEQLRAKETELEDLRLTNQTLETTLASNYTELDQLSAQWEALDTQVKSKVFNLNNLEERLLKSVNEKAKAETKYYEAVKAHQAAEAERKAIQRTVELQNKMVEQTEVAVPKLQQRINALETDCLALRKGNAYLLEKVNHLERENPDLRASLEVEKKRVHELSVLANERENFLLAKKKELRKREDEFIRGKKDMDRQIAQARKEADLHRNNSKSSVIDSELENLRSLLICSTCHGPARSTIITKCMHTFCKDCVDARLSTRQRKCPACNLAFGASDVHTFFLQ